VDVKTVELNARILVEWSAYGAPSPMSGFSRLVGWPNFRQRNEQGLRPAEVVDYLRAAGFEIKEIIERAPYSLSSTRADELTFLPDAQRRVYEDAA